MPPLPRSMPSTRRCRRGAHRRRQRQGRRRPGRNSPADHGQSLGRSAGELSPGRSGRAARRQDPLQPRPPVPPRAQQAVAGEGRYLADVAVDNDCAMRIGVNCGSVDPAKKDKYDADDSTSARCSRAALEHCEYLEQLTSHATSSR